MYKFLRQSFFLILFVSTHSQNFCGIENSTDLEAYISTYLAEHFLEKIDSSKIHVIVELGAYHGLDAIKLHQHYNCPVFTFECDDSRFKAILNNIAPFPEIKLVPLGAWHETKESTFYQSDFEGASSFYDFDLESLAAENRLSVEELVKQQNLYMHPTTAPCIRLDEWMEENSLNEIDLLCIDIQGACLNAFKGLGERIKKIKYIIAEVENRAIYQGEALFNEINAYMEKNGFQCFFEGDELFRDVMFINKKYL